MDKNMNSFQLDAYRPLPWSYLLQGCLPLGPEEVSVSRSGGCLSLGQGGLPLGLGVVSASGSGGYLPLGLGVVSASDSRSGCLPLGLGQCLPLGPGVCLTLGLGKSVCLWVQVACHMSFHNTPASTEQKESDRCKNITFPQLRLRAVIRTV